MIELFPIATMFNSGPWLQRFRGARDQNEARDLLVFEWSRIADPSIKRIGSRILETWSPVGIRIAEESSLVLQSRSRSIPSMNLRSIEVPGPRSEQIASDPDQFDIFLHYFGGMDCFSDVWFRDRRVKVEFQDPSDHDWLGANIICYLPNGDQLILSRIATVGYYEHDTGRVSCNFASSLEEAVKKIFDKIDLSS